jgi:hypothetical protein
MTATRRFRGEGVVDDGHGPVHADLLDVIEPDISLLSEQLG